MPADKVMMQQLIFFKNIAIAGGLLAFAALRRRPLQHRPKR